MRSVWLGAGARTAVILGRLSEIIATFSSSWSAIVPTKEIHFVFEYLGRRMAVVRYESVFDEGEMIAHGLRQTPMALNVTPISVR